MSRARSLWRKVFNIKENNRILINKELYNLLGRPETLEGTLVPEGLLLKPQYTVDGKVVTFRIGFEEDGAVEDEAIGFLHRGRWINSRKSQLRDGDQFRTLSSSGELGKTVFTADGDAYEDSIALAWKVKIRSEVALEGDVTAPEVPKVEDVVQQEQVPVDRLIADPSVILVTSRGISLRKVSTIRKGETFKVAKMFEVLKSPDSYPLLIAVADSYIHEDGDRWCVVGDNGTRHITVDIAKQQQ